MMIDLRRDWSELVVNMQREMERLMDDFATRKPPMVRFSPRTWEPSVDVYETDSEVVILVELAGVKEDDMEVIVDNSVVTIRGDRKDIKQGIKRTYSQMEILWGPFERDIPLPVSVDASQVKAFYESGFLEIILTKLNKEKSRPVNIKVR
jgi:HSP20 family protein